jgi:hypothetical protein
MWDYISVVSHKKPAGGIDPEPWQSENHPADEALRPPPVHLQEAWRRRAEGASARRSQSSEGRFGVLEFYDFLRSEETRINSEDDLWAIARERDTAGNRTWLEFLLQRRDLPQLLQRVQKAGAAPMSSQRQRLSRLDILSNAQADGTCACIVPGQWLTAAGQVLSLNGFAQNEVQLAVMDALDRGRAKKRNIFIYGDTSRAKSFLLKPLELIYKAYTVPDSGSHQLADLAGSEIIWLNDFTFDPTWLPWNKLKCFLEGDSLKVAVPKTTGSNYIFSADSPVFGAGPAPIAHASRKETQQMDSRWMYFEFHHYFNPATSPEIKPCAYCCATWLLASRQ